MPFETIPSSLIQVGRPTKKEIFQKAKDNFDDHEDRIILVEDAINKIVIFDFLVVNGAQYAAGTSLAGIAVWRAPSTFDLYDAVVTSITAGASGTTEFDIQVGSDLDTMTSVFTTRPSVSFSAGDNISSSNAVFSTFTINEGDFLRLDITSLQSPQYSFHLQVFGEI